MRRVVSLLKWLLKAAIFFTLFAFALNNQDDATVRFFFGTRWSAPMVIIILTAFGAGLAIGVMGMVPRWWRHRRLAAAALAQKQIFESQLPEKVPQAPPHGL
jgi:putative membrane protein